MTAVKLRPWPFENRIVKLHWFGKVRLNENHNWYIRVAFEDQSNISCIDLPIGILPLLRLGQYYKDGQSLSTQKDGSLQNILVADLNNGLTKKAIDVCKKFNYFLYGNAELINQKVWSFHSDNITYYISHVELIRALYLKNKTLANAMMRPNGLEYLVNEVYTKGSDTAYIEFSKEIPSSLIDKRSEEFIKHFGWLYFNKKIKQSFESIQSHIYANAASNNLSFGHPLEVVVPKIKNNRMAYRGIIEKNEVLIFEILGIDNLFIPFSHLDYSHFSIKKKFIEALHGRNVFLKLVNKMYIK